MGVKMANPEIVLLVGVTNVGKTTTGRIFANKLGYDFFDLDQEVKSFYGMTLDKFERQHPFPCDRQKLKTEVLKNLVYGCKRDAVIAVTLLVYARFYNSLIKEDVICIELQDSAKHIFERLVFCDENDIPYRDEINANEHKAHYMREVRKDITFFRKMFSKVELKCDIDNRDPGAVADELIKLIRTVRS